MQDFDEEVSRIDITQRVVGVDQQNSLHHFALQGTHDDCISTTNGTIVHTCFRQSNWGNSR